MIDTTRLRARCIALPLWTVAAVAVSCGVNATAAVTELKPQELAAFVARHPLVVVQVTSPDRNCGYCVGADKTFDAVSAQSSMTAISFARVQWSPWRNTPDFGSVMQVYGIPEQYVFKNGQERGTTRGRPADAAKLQTKIEALLEQQPAGVPEPDPPRAPLSTAQGKDVRLGVRHTVMQAVTRACAQRFPKQADRWHAQLTRWTAGHQAALDRGAVLTLNRSGPAEDTALRQLQKDEQRALQVWQVHTLGIAMDSPPREQDCSRVLDGLSTGAQDAPRQEAP